MSSDRKSRIQQLSRMNRRKAAIPELVRGLSFALARTVEADSIASLEDSDSLLEDFRRGYRSAKLEGASSYRRFFTLNERRKVFELATCLANQISGENVFLLITLNGETVAVVVEVSALLKRAEALLGLDGDSISIVSSDRGQLLLIDRNQDDPVQAFEVTAWGDRWPLCILTCDSKMSVSGLDSIHDKMSKSRPS
jgi:hypothetical protein